ncbi:aminoglycoside adenylyltransferase domain-containing protein [Paractinoplanes maris]|uniref:aminoglycoside adenylyltransferase domain-containing protein n=1 Tax=Paractinoplanes maris TaxID=1734446 RepID=UPI00201FCBBC|nr:aminoglycoside adenylyltransferase domain-containing protein [Actinoplanes maris]
MTAVDRIARDIDAILGPGGRAVILHGSLAAGGFRPGVSDIDLLAVVDTPLTDGQADSLVRLARDTPLGDAAGLDLDVVTTEVARHPTPAPPLELHLGRGLTESDPEIERRVATAPDLPAELSMARQDGRALTGTTDILAPVPAEWVIARGRHWLRTWQTRTDDTAHAAFMVLTACRIWRFATEHTHSPKADAARWALARDPSLLAVRQALQQYEGDPTTVVDEPGIAVLLALALRHTPQPG